MQLPEICIKRPVLATVLSLVILLVGVISYTRLAVREYPRIDEPVIAKVEADSQPVIYISVQSGERSVLQATDFVKRYVQPRLSVLPGASDVRIFGERQVSMRVDVDRFRLAGYKLTVQDVEDA